MDVSNTKGLVLELSQRFGDLDWSQRLSWLERLRMRTFFLPTRHHKSLVSLGSTDGSLHEKAKSEQQENANQA